MASLQIPDSARRITRRGLLERALAAIAATALAACSSPAPPPAPSPSSASSSPGPGSPTSNAIPASTVNPPPAQTSAAAKPGNRFRLGLVVPQFLYAPAFVAMDHGYYQRAGLNIEVVPLDSDAIGIKAVIAGEIDLVDTSPNNAMVSIEQGADVKIIGIAAKKNHFHLYAKKNINDVPDLVGKNLAISAPNALPHILALAVLRDANVDPSKVNFVAVGGPGLAPSLISGAVDASSAPLQALPLIVKEPNLHVVFAYKDRLPKLISATFIVSGGRLKARPDDFAAFATETARGVRFVLDTKNKPDVAAAVKGHTALSPEDIEFSWKWFTDNKVFEPNSYVSPEELTYWQELNMLVEIQKKILPPEQVATWDVQKRVVQALGEYKS